MSPLNVVPLPPCMAATTITINLAFCGDDGTGLDFRRGNVDAIGGIDV